MIHFLQKKCSFILLMLFVSSCSASSFVKLGTKETVVNDDYPDNKKGIVIIKTLPKNAKLSWRYYSKNNDIYQRSDLEREILSKTVSAEKIVSNGDDYQILMLEPGVYSFHYGVFPTRTYFYVVEDEHYFKHWEPLSTSGVPYIVAFEVKSGVVNYVGDIDLSGSPYNPKIYDNYQSAKLFFSKKYPKIKSPIIKNLAYDKFNKK